MRSQLLPSTVMMPAPPMFSAPRSRRPEVGIGEQSDGSVERSCEADNGAIEIDVIEMELARRAERAEQKCVAELVGVHARVAHRVSHQNGLH